MTRHLLLLLLLPLSLAQFSPFTSFPGPVQFSSSYTTRFANPGQLEFSNFVDLPSQRLRQPVGQPGPGSVSPDCALPLNTGGCITYTDVNTAFGQAAESLPFQPLKFPNIGNFSNEEIGNLGTVIHEATRILAKVVVQLDINRRCFNCLEIPPLFLLIFSRRIPWPRLQCLT